MNSQLELFSSPGKKSAKRSAAQATRKRSSTRRLPTKASTDEAALKNANLPENSTTGLPPYETIALVLQGGGALGAYQVGVFQGLQEAGIEPRARKSVV